MTSFALDHEWVEMTSGSEPVLDSTFAYLEIIVNDRSTLAILDKRGKTVRSRVLVPLFPLARWLVSNWWALFFEPESPYRNIFNPGYFSRHSMRSVGDGFAFPAFAIHPEGSFARLEWNQTSTAFQNIDYVSEGSAHIKRSLVSEGVSDLIESVLSRLEARDVGDEGLLDEWKAIREIPEEEAEFCEAAARLGLDPYDLDGDSAQSLIEIWEALPVMVRKDVFSASEFSNLGRAADWVCSGLGKIERDDASDGTWKRIRSLIGRGEVGQFPWLEGYRVAREIRGKAGFGDSIPIDLEKAAGAEFRVLSDEKPLIRGIDALFGMSKHSAPCCFTPKRNKTGQRFVQARALFDFLTLDAGQPSVITCAITERQQASRAFAAELLAPASLVKQRISSDAISENEISELADEFQVSEHVISRQIANHRICSILEPAFEPTEKWESGSNWNQTG
ncbi:MAG: hypothetical protein WCQ50_20530 [Spirochaetota bacterium]